MFGMGGSEILVILIVALLFLGPDKLPDAAKKISKGIRDIKRQSRALQQTIEDDENIGGALRDLRSALRGEEEPIRPRKPNPPKEIEAAATPDPVAAAAIPALVEGATAAAEPPPVSAVPDPGDADAEIAASAFESGHMTSPAEVAPVTPANGEHAAGPPKIALPPTAGERDESPPASAHADAELAALVKPAPNTIARGSAASPPSSEAPAAPAAAAVEPSEPEHG